MKVFEPLMWMLGIASTGVFLIYASSPPEPLAAGSRNESDHSSEIATEREGQTEHRTPDGSRVDVLTAEYAIEVERADKWQEAVGQSLYYGIATNRKPGIILLIENPERERRYYLRCLAVCGKHGIRLETRRIK